MSDKVAIALITAIPGIIAAIAAAFSAVNASKAHKAAKETKAMMIHEQNLRGIGVDPSTQRAKPTDLEV